MTKIIHYLLCLGILIGFGSCVKDSCNGSLGNTFDAVEVDSLSYSGDSLNALFNSTTLAALPENYFETWQANDSLTLVECDLNCTSNSLLLSINEIHLPLIDSSRSYNFNYAFEDRRNYIDCQHNGSSDKYTLVLSFDLYRTDTVTFTISNFSWQEFFLAGYL